MTIFHEPIEKTRAIYYNILVAGQARRKGTHMKRILAILLGILMLTTLLAGCQKEIASGTTETVSPEQQAQNTAKAESEDPTVNYEPKSTEALMDINDVPEADLSQIDVEYQYAEPVAGEEVATIHTNYGDISMKFFPEVAPKAVASFKALAKAGRFDNTIFHRVINSFMIQGGDYTAFNGTGGASAFGEEFDLEISDYLHNTEGAVAMANRGPGTNGSQFYINQVDNNYLDGSYTVFGQVFDGMEVVNDIAEVETDYSDKPLNNVVIESVEIYEYE